MEPVCLHVDYFTDVAERRRKGEERRPTSEGSARPTANDGTHTVLNRLFHVAPTTVATDGRSYCCEEKKV